MHVLAACRCRRHIFSLKCMASFKARKPVDRVIQYSLNWKKSVEHVISFSAIKKGSKISFQRHLKWVDVFRYSHSGTESAIRNRSVPQAQVFQKSPSGDLLYYIVKWSPLNKNFGHQKQSVFKARHLMSPYMT